MARCAADRSLVKSARLKNNTRQSAIKNYAWLALPSLSVIAELWFDWLPWLRGNDEWQWPLRATVDLARAIVPLLTLSVYVMLGAAWLHVFDGNAVSRRKERVFLLFLTLSAPVIQLALSFGVASSRSSASMALRWPGVGSWTKVVSRLSVSEDMTGILAKACAEGNCG